MSRLFAVTLDKQLSPLFAMNDLNIMKEGVGLE